MLLRHLPPPGHPWLETAAACFQLFHRRAAHGSCRVPAACRTSSFTKQVARARTQVRASPAPKLAENRAGKPTAASSEDAARIAERFRRRLDNGTAQCRRRADVMADAGGHRQSAGVVVVVGVEDVDGHLGALSTTNFARARADQDQANCAFIFDLRGGSCDTRRSARRAG